MKKYLVILGTRPEVIKLAPLVIELQKNNINVEICNTEQQKELSNKTLRFFGLKADYCLDVMTPNQTLSALQSRMMNAIQEIFLKKQFDGVFVQGDTMTAFCGSLISYYNKTPIYHVEAGLRSWNLFEPFPEEGLRQMISKLSTLNFAPTKRNLENLIKEGIDKNKIYITGNTVIDAVFNLQNKYLDRAKMFFKKKNIMINDKVVLITIHRRENHGKRLKILLKIIEKIVDKYIDHHFIIPVHPNPNVKDFVINYLKDKPNVYIVNPLDYPELIYIMKHSKLILTDSGGIQEEAPTFCVPVLVLRYKTERMESVEKGFSKLVGCENNLITKYVDNILSKDFDETRIIGQKNPYGDGMASSRIVKILKSL